MSYQFSINLDLEVTRVSIMHLQIRADLYSEKSQNFGRTMNIQEQPTFSIIPDNKMVKLSMKRKSTENSQNSLKKSKISTKEKSENQIQNNFEKMSIFELLREIDNVLRSF